MGLFNKIALIFKKRFLYKPDAERVDIRLNSIPDWLYKVTLKDSKDLKQLSKQTYLELIDLLKQVDFNLDKMELQKLPANDFSRYKLEVLEKSRETYVSKLREFIKFVNKEMGSIEEYRVFFVDLEKNYLALRQAIAKSSEKLIDLYKVDIAKIDKDISDVSGLILKFKDIFKGSNDEKVATIVRIVKEIEVKSLERVEIDESIEVKDKEISKVRSHIYKLSDKLELLRQSPRFRDVLEKEGTLGNLLEKKDDLIASIEKRFAPIEVVLYSYADKVREGALAKEYVTHFAQAIQHDKELEIISLLTGLNSDLNNKRTKIRKGVGELKAEQLCVQTEWLIANLSKVKDQIEELTRDIKTSRSVMRNYVVFNEIEDHESRIEFYQRKLKDLITERKGKIITIEKLNILGLKEKVRRELLLVTGYDVHVVYDED